MTIMFDLYWDDKKQDSKLISSIENTLGIKFQRIDKSYSSYSDKKSQYLLSVSPGALHCTYINSDKFQLENNIRYMKRFISSYFDKEVLGIKYYDDYSSEFVKDIENVELINI